MQVIATHNKIAVSELPLCDFCNTIYRGLAQAKYDARIPAAGNSWAHVCQYHFDFFYCKLGVGKGQELILKKEGQENG